MSDRIILFVLLVCGVLWCATTAAPPPRDTMQDARIPDPIGASMRERNAMYDKVCTGTVAQRRACWLSMPVAD